MKRRDDARRIEAGIGSEDRRKTWRKISLESKRGAINKGIRSRWAQRLRIKHHGGNKTYRDIPHLDNLLRTSKQNLVVGRPSECVNRTFMAR
jgi:hypothetical protein